MIEGLEFLKHALKYVQLDVVSDEGKKLTEEIGHRLEAGQRIGKKDRDAYLIRARDLIRLHRRDEELMRHDSGP